MSSSFFLKKTTKNNKRKLPDTSKSIATSNNKAKKTTLGKSNNKFSKLNNQGKNKSFTTTKPLPSKRRAQKDDEEIASSDDEDEDFDNSNAPNLVFSSDEGETETPQDKRLRLAKKYLEEVQEQEADRAEDRDLHDHVAQRLQKEYLDSVGRLRRQIADTVEGYEPDEEITLKHKLQHLSICAMALSPDGNYLYTGGKTQHVLKWNLDTLRVEGSFNVQPYTEEATNVLKVANKRRSHVIALCLSSDMKFLALAEGGNSVQIWCPQTLKHIKTFSGHRDLVTALVFRRDTHELYSGSRDRSFKIWSLDEMAYVESLFGHQAGITDIDALSRERAITCGGADSTLRIWKITEESQLIYNGSYQQGSIEHVRFLNDEHFISGSDNGALCLWSATKKKPLHVELQTHGLQANGTPYWITALACVVNTDLIATGSYDGYVRLWRTKDNTRKLEALSSIPVTGFINSLVFSNDGSKLYAAVGQEHRLGRWWRISEARNRIVIISLKRAQSKQNTEKKS